MAERPVRIANISGFYGDRLSAMREMLDGPVPVDVITGDWLAELTMLILWKAQQKDPSAGYATTFLRQMDDCLAECLERGIKVVSNAGGLNPSGLAEQLEKLGTGARIAYVEGDDVRHVLGDDHAVTANAYLGGWGIAEGLLAGADVVVTGRVTDAAVVLGPAAWWHGWSVDDWDRLAGAVAAGHVIECGPQATGGNYPFLDELPAGDDRYPGFPIAEIAADGSSVITKQPGTGGVVSVGTVTAQLLYEVAEPAYANPDVVARFDTLSLSQEGPDRVRISGCVGEPPPETLKVALNERGGWRNSMTLVITGTDAERKADRALTLLGAVLDAVAEVHTELLGAGDLHLLRIVVKDPDKEKVDRRFSNAVTELLLASYAGAFTTTPPGPASEFGIYRPASVPASLVEHAVVLPDGTRQVVPPMRSLSSFRAPAPETRQRTERAWGPTREAPLGAVCGARSGDKGGNANVGMWTRTDEAFEWLAGELTVKRFGELLPEAAELDVQRYEFANLRAVNFVVVGLLGDGVASTVRFDAQAKGLGEYVRSRVVEIPEVLL